MADEGKIPIDEAESGISGEANLRLHERPGQPTMLRQINERHKADYAERSQKLQEQLTETTFKIAMEQRQSEESRGISIKHWFFEGAVDDATRASAVVTKEHARRGGRSKKTDALQGLIIGIVRKKPELALSRLLAELRRMTGKGIIYKVDPEEHPNPKIRFEDGKRRKDATISGLKDRLSRAKKIVSKEIAETG